MGSSQAERPGCASCAACEDLSSESPATICATRPGIGAGLSGWRAGPLAQMMVNLRRGRPLLVEPLCEVGESDSRTGRGLGSRFLSCSAGRGGMSWRASLETARARSPLRDRPRQNRAQATLESGVRDPFQRYLENQGWRRTVDGLDRAPKPCGSRYNRAFAQLSQGILVEIPGGKVWGLEGALRHGLPVKVGNAFIATSV